MRPHPNRERSKLNGLARFELLQRAQIVQQRTFRTVLHFAPVAAAELCLHSTAVKVDSTRTAQRHCHPHTYLCNSIFSLRRPSTTPQTESDGSRRSPTTCATTCAEVYMATATVQRVLLQYQAFILFNNDAVSSMNE